MQYRKEQHLREARCQKRKNTYFHNALNKYGAENFKFEEIDFATSQEELDGKERYWISFYGSNDKSVGYNLDSGGRGGGTKSEETKRKIGLTTIEKWNNEEIAQKMRNGLLKGAETMKNNKKLYPFTCPICGKVIYYPMYELKHKKFCSLKCASQSKSWEKGVRASSKMNHERNMARKVTVKNDIIKWVEDNEELVLRCPYNKISVTLRGLKTMLEDKYNIKDLRSIYICFDVKNLKELLNKLKDAITHKENIC